MKNILSLILILTCLGSTHAQLENSLLWKVSGNGLESDSYLYGTFHSAEDEVYFLFDQISVLILECKVMAGEVNMKEESELNPMTLMNKMMMDSLSLEDLYSPEDFTYVKERLEEELGFFALAADKMKPIYISAMLSEELSLESMVNPKRILDDSLQVYSENLGLQIKGLESALEALDVIDMISLDEQARILLQSLEEMENESVDDLMEKLMELYTSQDLNGMMVLYEEQELGLDFESFLVDYRNDYFVDRLIILMQENPTFCAVGSLHLPGESGMINQLRILGFTVEPILLRPSER